MLTIFTIPKPFVGHIGIIQRNAIISWLHLVPKCEIILFGDDPGIREIAEEFGLIHVPDIHKNQYGTPYLDDVFSKAQNIAHNTVLCYTNADIIFFNDLPEAVGKIPVNDYLMVGERWDVDITTPVTPSQENWTQDLFNFVLRHHTLQNFPGMDYFIFPKGLFPGFPPFLVGRRGWDNWLIYHVREKKIPVIDATQVIHAVHQNHSYSHIPEKKGPRWEGPESDCNIRLAQNRTMYLWELADSDWLLMPDGLKKKPFSLRTLEQDIVLISPQKLHPLFEPFYRCGHLIKYGFLRMAEPFRK
ncbi:MAG TPA: hypothetical protein PKM50_09065 [Methanoregula sp.]|nr:hypothetical protein [Methanoregula sp.]